MKISVCMATYNGEKYIKEQLDSILFQLSDNDEVIISDDHSTDGTIEVIKSYNDGRIKVFMNSKEKGYTRNFENALEKASGDIIFLSDQDDVWMDDKIKISLENLKNHDMVVCNAELVDSNLNKMNETIFEFRNVKSGFISNFIQIKYLGCSMAFKRSILDKSLPFPAKQKLIPHDSWLTLVGEMFYKVKLIEKPLMYYRRHDNNVSNGGAKSPNPLWKKIQIRLYVLWNLFKITLSGK